MRGGPMNGPRPARPRGDGRQRRSFPIFAAPREIGPVAAFRLFIEKDVPEIDLEPGNSFFSDTRAKMTFADLLREFESTYKERADFVAGLGPEQLGRKGHIPALKGSPLGDYPTLGALFQGIGEYHLTFHIDHMRETSRPSGLPQNLRAAGKAARS